MRHGRNRDKESTQRARDMRKSMSKSELRLWCCLKDEQLGFKFRRQYAFERYFLDFYCAEAALCIEVDGEQHEDQLAYDSQRDARLQAKGIFTYRIPADSLYVALGEILYKITQICEERTGRKGLTGFEWYEEAATRHPEPPPNLPLPLRGKGRNPEDE